MLRLLEAGLERVLFVLLELGLLPDCLAEKVAVPKLLPVVVGFINFAPLLRQVVSGHVEVVVSSGRSLVLGSLSGGSLLFLHF